MPIAVHLSTVGQASLAAHVERRNIVKAGDTRRGQPRPGCARQSDDQPQSDD